MKTRIEAVQVVAIIVIAVCSVTAPAVPQDCPELVGRWPYGLAKEVAASGTFADGFESGDTSERAAALP